MVIELALGLSVVTALLCVTGSVILLRANLFETDEVKTVRQTATRSPFVAIGIFALGMPVGLGVIYLLALYVGSVLTVLQVLAFSVACGYLGGALKSRAVGWIAFAVSAGLYVLLPLVIVHNLLAIVAVLFAVSAFSQVVIPWMFALLCVGLSVYDIVAVHQIGAMQETVKRAADFHFVPAFLFPNTPGGYFQSVRAALDQSGSLLFIGIGDYVFASALSTLPFYPSAETWDRPWLYAVCLSTGALGGLYGSGFATMLPFFDRGVAALPFITVGALLGWGIGWVLERLYSP